MDSQQILIFLVTFSSILILPGPNAAFAVGQSLRYGVIKSLPVQLGFMSATGVHAMLVLCGMGLLIQEHIIILRLLKWVGVIYLIYLAYKLFTAAPSTITVPLQEISSAKMFWSAMLVSLTNPKALLASIMIYPLFIDDGQAYFFQAMVLICSAMSVSFLIYLTYSLMAAALQHRLTGSQTANKTVACFYLGAAGVLSAK